MIQRRNQAFTLIELMIVIAIIAILAGILVPNFVRARQEAKLAACKQNLMAIGQAIEAYQIRHSRLKDVQLSGKYSVLYSGSELVEEGYLKKVPRCPASNGYYYWRTELRNGVEYHRVYHADSNAHKGVGITGIYPEYDSRLGIIDTGDNNTTMGYY